jgi:hypothetical protein
VLYDNSSSCVFINGQVSEPFDITTGVLQGDVLAPFLFIIVIDYVSKLSAGKYGYMTHKGTSNDASGRCMRHSTHTVSRLVNDLAFADDIALLENTNSQAQSQLDSLRHNALTVGLEINVKKTEQMRLNQPATSSPPPPLIIDGQSIEIVDEFKYLGSYMGSTEKDVANRIALAWGAFNKLKPILTRTGKPSVKLKLRLFNAACISILLYGCESWVLTAQQANKFDVFARTCYRIILGIRQSEAHITNKKLYQLADNARPTTQVIRERQLQFTGHCLRMNEKEPANIYALYTSSVAKNRRGKPRRSYLDQISAYLCSDRQIRLEATEIVKLASDRKAWKKIVIAPHQPDR